MSTQRPRLPDPPKDYDQSYLMALIRLLDKYFATIDNPGDQVFNSVQFVAAPNPGKGLILRDSQATPHYWQVTVSNTGVLQTTDLGTSNPVG